MHDHHDVTLLKINRASSVPTVLLTTPESIKKRKMRASNIATMLNCCSLTIPVMAP